MDTELFRTAAGDPIPAVTAPEMAEIDRIAVEEIGLGIVQMMEHAGRELARAVLDSDADRLTVVAGGGGNGGGGLACARHLAARDRLHAVVLDRSPTAYEGAAATQLDLVESTEAELITTESDPDRADEAISTADGVVDALIGYGLRGAPRGPAAELIAEMNTAGPVTSLDVPSGVDATTGEAAGGAVTPDLTVTLALPKTGLTTTESEILCVDLGIPATVYEAAEIPYENPFGDEFSVRLTPVD
ncbi:MAG: YjeF related protein [Halonotius sp. J07HN6]|nr:MAG: YjeF related protein [Halonotius sp. J07HN6]